MIRSEGGQVGLDRIFGHPAIRRFEAFMKATAAAGKSRAAMPCGDDVRRCWRTLGTLRAGAK